MADVARPSKAEVLNELHAEALAEFDAIQSAMHDERMQCLEDRRFGQLAGAQWEGALGDQPIRRDQRRSRQRAERGERREGHANEPIQRRAGEHRRVEQSTDRAGHPEDERRE